MSGGKAWSENHWRKNGTWILFISDEKIEEMEESFLEALSESPALLESS